MERDLQGRIKDRVGEEHNAFNKNASNTNNKGASAVSPAALEKVMVQYSW